jgi:hypothetical protein
VGHGGFGLLNMVGFVDWSKEGNWMLTTDMLASVYVDFKLMIVMRSDCKINNKERGGEGRITM